MQILSYLQVPARFSVQKTLLESVGIALARALFSLSYFVVVLIFRVVIRFFTKRFIRIVHRQIESLG